jgi:biotin carboxyl carrier protein
MAMPFRLSGGRRDWLASVEGSVVTIDGVEGEFLITARPDGRWSITHSANATPASIAVGVQAPDGVWTGVDGATTQWQVEPASSRVRHRVVDGSIRAPMSATVIRLHVSVGSAVSEGDPLVVVEAMKMEMPLRAPRDGRIKAVHCREGELVPAAAVLVELE